MRCSSVAGPASRTVDEHWLGVYCLPGGEPLGDRPLEVCHYEAVLTR